MDSSQFDTITRLFASRRLSRRSIMLTGAGMTALGVAGGAAQATPDAVTGQATPDAGSDTGVSFMFVQTFGAGSIDAATDGAETLFLVADHVAGQTLYFSDRPERIVGMVPTEVLLGAGSDAKGLGFTPADPPNAALILPDDKILIVELIDPTYDAAFGQVRYQLRVLDDVTQIDLQLEGQPLTAADAVGDFTAASLFIDDCPDGSISCVPYDNSDGGSIPSGFCYDWQSACCQPCASNSLTYWIHQCAATFEHCGDDNCAVNVSETWQCHMDT